jgi:A/G-specific adenine glycosylase
MYWLEIITLTKLIRFLTFRVLDALNRGCFCIKVLKKMEIHQKLKFWYQSAGRDLPWRHTSDPYFIWLSEVILQQTRVDQGLPYYYAFTQQYPTVHDLANAHEDEVFRLWQGLGYYSRAKSLLKTAKEVQHRYNGNFPASYQELLALPGIGPYTAAAIASFAFNLPHPVVDGNVKRVVSRCLQIQEPIESKVALNEIQIWLDACMQPSEPAIFNQAIMELGALICFPKSPLCSVCPIQAHCLATQSGRPTDFPIKKSKPAKRILHLSFAWAWKNGKFAIQKRGNEGIWANLWELPSIETPEPSDIQIFEPIFSGLSLSAYRTFELPVHLLSHREIRARVFLFKTESDALHQVEWISPEMRDSYGFPRILTRFFEQNEKAFRAHLNLDFSKPDTEF